MSFRLATILLFGFLTATISSARLDSISEEIVYNVSRFRSYHIPHGPWSETHFEVHGPQFKTWCCNTTRVQTDSNAIANVHNATCEDPFVTFSVVDLLNEWGNWSFSVTYDGVTRYKETRITFFETEDGERWQNLDLPKSFVADQCEEHVPPF